MNNTDSKPQTAQTLFPKANHNFRNGALGVLAMLALVAVASWLVKINEPKAPVVPPTVQSSVVIVRESNNAITFPSTERFHCDSQSGCTVAFVSKGTNELRVFGKVTWQDHSTYGCVLSSFMPGKYDEVVITGGTIVFERPDGMPVKMFNSQIAKAIANSKCGSIKGQLTFYPPKSESSSIVSAGN